VARHSLVTGVVCLVRDVRPAEPRHGGGRVIAASTEPANGALRMDCGSSAGPDVKAFGRGFELGLVLGSGLFVAVR